MATVITFVPVAALDGAVRLPAGAGGAAAAAEGPTYLTDGPVVVAEVALPPPALGDAADAVAGEVVTVDALAALAAAVGVPLAPSELQLFVQTLAGDQVALLPLAHGEVLAAALAHARATGAMTIVYDASSAAAAQALTSGGAHSHAAATGSPPSPHPDGETASLRDSRSAVDPYFVAPPPSAPPERGRGGAAAVGVPHAPGVGMSDSPPQLGSSGTSLPVESRMRGASAESRSGGITSAAGGTVLGLGRRPPIDPVAATAATGNSGSTVLPSGLASMPPPLSAPIAAALPARLSSGGLHMAHSAPSAGFVHAPAFAGIGDPIAPAVPAAGGGVPAAAERLGSSTDPPSALAGGDDSSQTIARAHHLITNSSVDERTVAAASSVTVSSAPDRAAARQPSPGTRHLKFHYQKGNVLFEQPGLTLQLCINVATSQLLVMRQLTRLRNESRAEWTARVGRAEREVQFMKANRHPHVVRCIGKENKDPRVYRMFIEYLPGGTLRQLVLRFGPLRESMARRYARQLAAVLVESHRRGIVHTALMTDHVLLSGGGGIKLAGWADAFGGASLPDSGGGGGGVTASVDETIADSRSSGSRSPPPPPSPTRATSTSATFSSAAGLSSTAATSSWPSMTVVTAASRATHQQQQQQQHAAAMALASKADVWGLGLLVYELLSGYTCDWRAVCPCPDDYIVLLTHAALNNSLVAKRTASVAADSGGDARDVVHGAAAPPSFHATALPPLPLSQHASPTLPPPLISPDIAAYVPAMAQLPMSAPSRLAAIGERRGPTHGSDEDGDSSGSGKGSSSTSGVSPPIGAGSITPAVTPQQEAHCTATAPAKPGWRGSADTPAGGGGDASTAPTATPLSLWSFLALWRLGRRASARKSAGGGDAAAIVNSTDLAGSGSGSTFFAERDARATALHAFAIAAGGDDPVNRSGLDPNVAQPAVSASSGRQMVNDILSPASSRTAHATGTTDPSLMPTAAPQASAHRSAASRGATTSTSLPVLPAASTSTAAVAAGAPAPAPATVGLVSSARGGGATLRGATAAAGNHALVAGRAHRPSPAGAVGPLLDGGAASLAPVASAPAATWSPGVDRAGEAVAAHGGVRRLVGQVPVAAMALSPVLARIGGAATLPPPLLSAAVAAMGIAAPAVFAAFVSEEVLATITISQLPLHLAAMCAALPTLPPLPDDVTPQARAFLCDCTRINAQERPTMAELLARHPFLVVPGIGAGGAAATGSATGAARSPDTRGVDGTSLPWGAASGHTVDFAGAVVSAQHDVGGLDGLRSLMALARRPESRLHLIAPQFTSPDGGTSAVALPPPSTSTTGHAAPPSAATAAPRSDLQPHAAVGSHLATASLPPQLWRSDSGGGAPVVGSGVTFRLESSWSDRASVRSHPEGAALAAAAARYGRGSGTPHDGSLVGGGDDGSMAYSESEGPSEPSTSAPIWRPTTLASYEPTVALARSPPASGERAGATPPTASARHWQPLASHSGVPGAVAGGSDSGSRPAVGAPASRLPPAAAPLVHPVVFSPAAVLPTSPGAAALLAPPPAVAHPPLMAAPREMPLLPGTLLRAPVTAVAQLHRPPAGAVTVDSGRGAGVQPAPSAVSSHSQTSGSTHGGSIGLEALIAGTSEYMRLPRGYLYELLARDPRAPPMPSLSAGMFSGGGTVTFNSEEGTSPISGTSPAAGHAAYPSRAPATHGGGGGGPLRGRGYGGTDSIGDTGYSGDDPGSSSGYTSAASGVLSSAQRAHVGMLRAGARPPGYIAALRQSSVLSTGEPPPVIIESADASVPLEAAYLRHDPVLERNRARGDMVAESRLAARRALGKDASGLTREQNQFLAATAATAAPSAIGSMSGSARSAGVSHIEGIAMVTTASTSRDAREALPALPASAGGGSSSARGDTFPAPEGGGSGDEAAAVGRLSLWQRTFGAAKR